MAVVFILCSLSVVFTNLGSLGKIFMMIFKGALNGFVAVPNLIALLGLSGVVIKLTKEHFAKDKLSA